MKKSETWGRCDTIEVSPRGIRNIGQTFPKKFELPEPEPDAPTRYRRKSGEQLALPIEVPVVAAMRDAIDRFVERSIERAGCIHLDLGGGVRVIACQRGRRKRK